MPVGLWYDSHFIAGGFQYASDDCCAKRRVIYISVSAEQNNVEFCPAA